MSAASSEVLARPGLVAAELVELAARADPGRGRDPSGGRRSAARGRVLGRARAGRAGRRDRGRQRLGPLPWRPARGAGDRAAVRDEHLSADVVVRAQLLQFPRQPAGPAELHRAQQLREGADRSGGLGPPADDRAGGRADGRRADGRGLSAGAPVREEVSAAPRPPDAGADPDDALVRRGRRLLPLLLRADLRALEPGGAAVHRRAVHPARQPRRRARRDRVRRRLDVVAVRDAAGARRPGQRAQVPVRGGRDRSRLVVAALLDDHLPLHPRPAAAGAAVPHDRGVQAVRRRVPDHRRRARHLDRDDRGLRLPPRLPVLPHQPERGAALHPAVHRDRA